MPYMSYYPATILAMVRNASSTSRTCSCIGIVCMLKYWEWLALDFTHCFCLSAGASLIPLFKGAKNEAFGPFSPKAELINGRAAMIGFAAMLAIEAVKGSALF